MAKAPKQKGRWVEFRVQMFVPEEATVEQAREYIHDWVACGRGSILPDSGDPMWHLDPYTVRVAQLRRKKP